MQSISRAAAREIDRLATEQLGIPSLWLMENAAGAVARRASEILEGKKLRRIAIVCGTGNNGGDGLAAARSLFDGRIELKIFVLGQERQLQGDPKIQHEILRKCKIPTEFVDGVEALERFHQGGALLWIDGIFGTGCTREVQGLSKQAIEFMNSSKNPILSIDVPSGLNADTGEIMGAAIQAEDTITFVRPKIGFFKKDGPRCVGRISAAGIGIPEVNIQEWIQQNA